MVQPVLRTLILLGTLLLAGCAANQMPGFQNTYYSYNVPESLLDQIKLQFRKYGLDNARIERDNVGRVQLKGGYRNEDEVDRAFIIVQSIIGLKSTSPFYPENIKEKRWEIEARQALANTTKITRAAPAKPQKFALVIGINEFLDFEHWRPIPGADDAGIVMKAAEKAGYKVTSLLGNKATKLNIEAALKKMNEDVGQNDSLFIYISSHGAQPLPSHEGVDSRKMSIIAYDSGNKNINNKTDYLLNLNETAVPDSLVQRLAKKRTRNTRILIDTCYSGEMLKGIPDDSHGYILKTNDGQPERAGIALSSWVGQEYTTKGIRFNDESTSASSVRSNNKARPKDVVQDWGDSSRAYTIFTATSENQESLAPASEDKFFFPNPLSPNKTLRGSYFTQVFFAYLDHYNGQMEPAFEEARIYTANKALEVTHGRQKQVPRRYSTMPTGQNNLYQ